MMMNPTKSQNRNFEMVQGFHGIVIEDAEELGYGSKTIILRFEYTDPTARGLKDEGFAGQIFLGPRGGVTGTIHGLGYASIDQKIQDSSGLWSALECRKMFAGRDADRHTDKVRDERLMKAINKQLGR